MNFNIERSCYMINFKYAKKYCNEDISLIENYEKAIADKDKMWQCHHIKELTTSKKQLIENNEYYNRPANELIFLTNAEHRALHMKGNKIWLGKHRSYETRRKISESHKNMSDETKRKMSEYRKSGHWFNNGIKSVFVKECPAGFVRGMIKRKKYE